MPLNLQTSPWFCVLTLVGKYKSMKLTETGVIVITKYVKRNLNMVLISPLVHITTPSSCYLQFLKITRTVPLNPQTSPSFCVLTLVGKNTSMKFTETGVIVITKHVKRNLNMSFIRHFDYITTPSSWYSQLLNITRTVPLNLQTNPSFCVLTLVAKKNFALWKPHHKRFNYYHI